MRDGDGFRFLLMLSDWMVLWHTGWLGVYVLSPFLSCVSFSVCPFGASLALVLSFLLALRPTYILVHLLSNYHQPLNCWASLIQMIPVFKQRKNSCRKLFILLCYSNNSLF